MEPSDDRNCETRLSVSGADELLSLLLDDDHGGFFDTEYSSLLDSDALDFMVPPPTALSSDLEGVSDFFQLEPATASAFGDANTQFERAEPRNTRYKLETTKKKSTFQRKKEELACLQSQLLELEAQLSRLRDSERQTAGPTQDTQLDRSLRETAASLSLWEVVAKRQLNERNRAEQENAALRKLLKEQRQLAKSLKQMLRKRLALQASDQQQQLLEVGEEDSEVFQVLLHSIEQRMRTVDGIFEAHGLSTKATNVNSARVVSSNGHHANMHAEFVNAVLIAVDLPLLSTTVWQILCAGQARPEGLNVRVIKLTDDVIVMKQMIQSPPSSTGASSGSTTIMHSVLKQVTQENRMLLLWERLIEKTEAASSGIPVTYLSQFGCVQIVRANDRSREGHPVSLAQSYTQLKPMQTRKVRLDPGQTQQRGAPHSMLDAAAADLVVVAALYQQNRHKFFHFVQSELEGVVRELNNVQI